MSKVHDLINAERKRRKLSTFNWSREMARLAQSQADYCAKVGYMVHSSRYAFQGGENLAMGGRNFSPRAIVNCWLNSKAGHREFLLSSRVRKAGVGIAKSRGKTFVAWAFSSEAPSYPDCLHYKGNRKKRPIRFNFSRVQLCSGGKGMLRIPVSVLIGLCGLWGIILGAHGLYVYFSTWELLLDVNADMLFMTFGVPGKLGDSVLWMSFKGLQSWFIPVAVFVGSWVVVAWSGLWGMFSGLLSKSKLWR